MVEEEQLFQSFGVVLQPNRIFVKLHSNLQTQLNVSWFQ